MASRYKTGGIAANWQSSWPKNSMTSQVFSKLLLWGYRFQQPLLIPNSTSNDIHLLKGFNEKRPSESSWICMDWFWGRHLWIVKILARLTQAVWSTIHGAAPLPFWFTRLRLGLQKTIAVHRDFPGPWCRDLRNVCVANSAGGLWNTHWFGIFLATCWESLKGRPAEPPGYPSMGRTFMNLVCGFCLRYIQHMSRLFQKQVCNAVQVLVFEMSSVRC